MLIGVFIRLEDGDDFHCFHVVGDDVRVYDFVEKIGYDRDGVV